MIGTAIAGCILLGVVVTVITSYTVLYFREERMMKEDIERKRKHREEFFEAIRRDMKR